MIRVYKVFLPCLIMIFLSACGISHPKIEKKRDEFSKNNVCRLQNYCLKKAWGRQIFLYLEKDGNNIKTVLQVNGVNHKYDFRHNPNVTFELYDKNKIIDKIMVKAQTIDIKDWQETIHNYINGIVITTTVYHSTASSIVPLTKDNLKRIANTDSGQFLIEGNNDSIKGKLTKTDLEWFKQFDKQCFAVD